MQTLWTGRRKEKGPRDTMQSFMFCFIKKMIKFWGYVHSQKRSTFSTKIMAMKILFIIDNIS